MHRRPLRSPGQSLQRQPLRRCNPHRVLHRWQRPRYRLKKAFLAGSKTCLAPSRKLRRSLHQWHRPKPRSARVKPAVMVGVNVVSRVASARSGASAVAVMAVAVVVAAVKDAPRVARKASLAQKDVRKVALTAARKAVAENAANAILKAVAIPVVRSARNVPPAKPAPTATQKVAPKTANRAMKAAVVRAAVVDATAVTAATVANAPRVTRSSRTSQRPIRRQWPRPWVAAMPPAHRHVARTDPLLKPVRTRAIVRKLTARKATGSPVATASHVVRAAGSVVVTAVAAATTAAVNAVIASTARTPRQTRSP